MPDTAHRVLVLFAHPAVHRSRVNRVLRDAVTGVDGVTVHDLYEAYPEFDIRVAHEQELLRTHDVVVLQHPLYWYSCPAIVKQWLDIVLTHGWAYGHGGDALRGKVLMNAITTGGAESTYQPDGLHRAGIRELLLPFERTADLCGMRYLPPFAVHGSLRLRAEEAPAHAADYRRVVEALRDGVLDPDAAAPRINLPQVMVPLRRGVPGG